MTSSTSINRLTTSPTIPALLALSPFVAGLLAALVLMSMGRTIAAIALAGGTMLTALVLVPRISFWLFLVSIAVWLPQRMTTTFAVQVFDIMLAVTFAGVALEFLLKSDGEIRPTGFDIAFLILIAATLVSAVFAFNPAYSVVPMIRIVTIYLAFRIFFKYTFELGVRRILMIYISLVVLLSLSNVAQMILSGGKTRAFGLAALGYEPMSMTALPMALAFLLWASRTRERLLYGLATVSIAAGIVATQARGPLLTVIIATLALLWFAQRKANRESNRQVGRTALIVIVVIALITIVAVSLSTNLLANAWLRYEEFLESARNPAGTIALRFILWKTALRTFLDHPITGIGIGNFRVVHEMYPDVRVIPLYTQVKGMSAHNVLLHYLAETGLIGTLSLVALTILGLRASYRTFKLKLERADSQVSAALFIAMFVFGITLIYMRAWTWGEGGYVMALLFGLVAAWCRRISQTTLCES
jgi:O-antigen ligase